MGGKPTRVTNVIRALRFARGEMTQAELAERVGVTRQTVIAIEQGRYSPSLETAFLIARALGTTLDQLVEPVDDEDVVIRPEPQRRPGETTWLLSRDRPGTMVAKMRITPERAVGPEHQRVHPGHEWFTVLSGTAVVYLADRRILVHEGQAAEFSTMVPHSFGAHDGPVEILTIFDQEGERAHLSGADPA